MDNVKSVSGSGKYVPPHLRRRNIGQGDAAQQEQQQQQTQEPKQNQKQEQQLKHSPSLLSMKQGTSAAVLLPASVAEWNDNMELVNYSQNEGVTAHSELIVLDLNGTLLKRGGPRKDKTRWAYPRPHLHDFLKFATENFAVMVWSTAQPHNVSNMVSMLLSPYYKQFVRVWDRRFCDLNGSYFAKSPSMKDLRKITDGFTLADSPTRNIYGSFDGYLGMNPERKGHWKMENIILVDDSESKAALQKDNHIFISSFEDKTNESQDNELLALTRYLQEYVQNKQQYSSLLAYVLRHPWPEFRQ
ncbi:hypothetical protein IWW48_004536 [Coemansia sp. RSA 1200]|nr:hypothetical protein IWW48_004536 [Coemansia sp. RSA 1200]